MDYRKAIEYFERRMELKEKEVPSENQYIKQADDTLREIYKTTISGMQELQALHEQGINLERLKDIDFRKEVVEHINYMEYMSVKDELEEYKQLGTLEEVREAVEKQQKKKPKTKMLSGDIEWWCPSCGESHIMMDSKKGFSHCHHCGQKLDWSEKDER